MCEQETDRLRTALAEARVIAQNNQQTNELIARLSPTATPAWLVNSPYTSIYPPTTPTTPTFLEVRQEPSRWLCPTFTPSAWIADFDYGDSVTPSPLWATSCCKIKKIIP